MDSPDEGAEDEGAEDTEDRNCQGSHRVSHWPGEVSVSVPWQNDSSNTLRINRPNLVSVLLADKFLGLDRFQGVSMPMQLLLSDYFIFYYTLLSSPSVAL